MNDVYVIGVGMTPFGKHPDRTAADLAAEAILGALDDAGVKAADIEAAWVGHVFQGMAMGQRGLGAAGMSGLPITNVENACSSGSTAIFDAATALKAGIYDVVLACGVELLSTKFRGALAPDESDIEAQIGLTMPAVYAMRARRHMEQYGTTSRMLAAIASKNKFNASLNPLAQFKKPVSVDEVLAGRMIADPLHLHECAPVSDGAAAVVLISGRKLNQLGASRAVRLAASQLRSGKLEVGLPDMTIEDLTWRTAEAAYRDAGLGPEDVGMAEVHDCFSIAEATRVEGLKLYPRGEYPARVERGEANIDGRLPVNMSGGLLGKGHPLGATGVAQVIEIVKQLRHEAEGRQVEGARVGLAHCRGGKARGVEGTACTVNILTI
ncbi:MAG: thiolase [Sulfobacillus benefaciens]|uniref:Thiolase n=1 Tax=Sulfobacillus benefaciens TaxID=453960 RepID=A0A2T2X3S8_9FIRM|nr:MAG: thiolase [Sulfobacillus benefaciens]